MTNLQILADVGFVRVGAWRLEQGGLDYDIDANVRDKRWALYAFVDGEDVLYIGKSTIPFQKRMHGYKRPGASQKTNIKNNAFIAEMIRSEKGVEIYLFEGEKKIEYRGMSINLAAGLEDPLIAKLRPKWNQTGKIQSA